MNCKDIIGMAREANLWQSWLERLEESTKTIASLEQFAALVAAHEREACAKVCENSNTWDLHDPNGFAANLIRARGEK